MKTIMFVWILAFLVLPGCKGGGAGQEHAPESLVTVNGASVSAKQFRMEFEKLPDYARQQYSSPDGARALLEELVNRELLYQQAISEGLDDDPAFLAALESFRKAGLSSMLIDRAVKKGVEITDAEIKDFYENNKDNFVVPGKAHAAHILLKTEKEARGILERLEKGADFAKLARERSIDDNTRDAGGDLGFFPSGQMVAEFDQAVFSLEPGGLSGPVKTEFGYHIIKLIEKTAPEEVDLDTVSDLIRSRLVDERRKTAYSDLIKDLRKRAEIGPIDEAALTELAGKL